MIPLFAPVPIAALVFDGVFNGLLDVIQLAIVRDADVFRRGTNKGLGSFFDAVSGLLLEPVAFVLDNQPATASMTGSMIFWPAVSNSDVRPLPGIGGGSGL
ncbi:hypothetical protein NHF46_06650 [Arthrobacter alpinus]|nr:hypothetical protein [Arthrobacter alpinus]